jgi:hypothetical protein
VEAARHLGIALALGRAQDDPRAQRNVLANMVLTHQLL